MNGLKSKRLSILLFLCFISCNEHKISSKIKDDIAHCDSISSDNDIKLMRRSLGEIAYGKYTDYDFYLSYVRGGAWQVSSFYSLMLKDSIVYSYAKYLDNTVSINFPPSDVILGKDSFFYSVTYREHRMEQLDSLIKKMNQVGYWSNKYLNSFIPNREVAYLFAYCKNKGEYKLKQGIYDKDFENLVISYIRDTFMQYSPVIDKKLYRTKIKL